MKRRSARAVAVASACALVAVLAAACTAAIPSGPRGPQFDGEAATSDHLAAIRTDPAALLAFLQAMPKGGDLHNHLSGAVYAESYLRWAQEDNDCIVTMTFAILAPPCDEMAGRMRAADALRAPGALDRAIDAFSMRNWNPAESGHDHFFAAFAKFGPASTKTGEMLAEVTARAAAEHVSYMELMLTPYQLATAYRGLPADTDRDFRGMRDRLIAAGLKAVVGEAKERLDAAELRQRQLLRCGTPTADQGCQVTVRYIAQIVRTASPARVFAQMLAGFEIAAAEPRVVAVNLVAPEDNPVASGDYSLHMQMLDALHALYPGVRITLHAGEIVAGLAPPAALRSHIREAIEVGHAERIGHGVDVGGEDNAGDLFREMGARHILVEIALTSNDLILGVRGRQHPLSKYLEVGVPVALATDDLGVSRSSHTQEFVRAVVDQGLDYRTLKRLVRNSLEYAFVDARTKARLQATLDDDFQAFERRP